MINHPDERLSAYMDDELNETERLEVEHHLASCERCRELLEDLLGLRQAVVGAYEHIQAPNELESRILQALDQKPTPEPAAKGWLSIPLVSLALLSVLLIMTGTVIVKMLSGVVKVLIALLYFVSHFIATAPVLSGLTILLAVGVLMLSGYSLRQLLLSNE